MQTTKLFSTVFIGHLDLTFLVVPVNGYSSLLKIKKNENQKRVHHRSLGMLSKILNIYTVGIRGSMFEIISCLFTSIKCKLHSLHKHLNILVQGVANALHVPIRFLNPRLLIAFCQL